MFRNQYDTGARCVASARLSTFVLSLQNKSSCFSADVTTWSPQGRLHQMECESLKRCMLRLAPKQAS